MLWELFNSDTLPNESQARDNTEQVWLLIPIQFFVNRNVYYTLYVT